VNALQFITWTAQAVLLAILVPALVRAVRERTRWAIDIALFFGLLDALLLRSLLGLANVPILAEISAALVYALPYLMLRLLIDFGTVSSRVARAAEIGLGALVLSAIIFPAPTPPLITILRTLYFVGMFAYEGVGFARLVAASRGVTRRRMQAVSAGNILFALVIAVAGALAFFPAIAQPGSTVIAPGILATSLLWLVGFAPPAALRRSWQEPELRTFLARAAFLPRLHELSAVVREIEEAAGAALGANAVIGLWDEAAQELRFATAAVGLPAVLRPGDRSPAMWALMEQKALYIADVDRSLDPVAARAFREASIRAILAAPIISDTRTLGVLRVEAARPPIFSEEDLDLVRLLADQAATILETRELIEETARAHALEEAGRLREDLLSEVAHDLKTPLTALYGHAQLLQRRIHRSGAQDPAILERILWDLRRLARLVDDLFDASRIRHGGLALRMEPNDLSLIARELHASRPEWVRVQLDANEKLAGLFDRARIEQVIDNLVANALKYSDDPLPVVLRLWREVDSAHIEVRDQGIGIPAGDLERIFERFQRASNLASDDLAGIGLGLFICRGIVEGHGGRIWGESVLAVGTTIHVVLPLIGADSGARGRRTTGEAAKTRGKPALRKARRVT
jgi:signal transduction histidine kinase